MPDSENPSASPPHATPGLARKLGLFDATMVVMGGIVGAGIFMNPSVVARQVHTPLLILGVWVLGGLIALAAAFIYAELAARLPAVGGQYAYLREAYHPGVAFLYGWALLLVIQTGGMAAVALTFARYFVELTGTSFSDKGVAVAALVPAHPHQLPGRAGRKHVSERVNADENSCSRCAGGLWVAAGGDSAGHLAPRARSPHVTGSHNLDRGGDGAGIVYLRGLADGQLHRRRGA